jgi:hypothetical protein
MYSTKYVKVYHKQGEQFFGTIELETTTNGHISNKIFGDMWKQRLNGTYTKLQPAVFGPQTVLCP